MGSVWQAEHLTLKTPCAVKFIEGELASVAEAHARFEREAQAAAQLRSPHVVQIFDHGTWQGTPYIAMELLDGEDLGKRIATRGGRLSPAEICPVMQQVCRALTKAHGAGIVHRDLKPDNVFLVRDDDREIVKVLDFGVAKQTAQAIDGSNTKTGAMLGTPYYMSPEQAQGIKSVDSRSDLWSLAVIVFQCLTGRLPFESEALGDLLVKIIVSPIPTPSEVAPDVPVGFDRWWAKAAARDPAQRFATAKEFADSLQLACGQSVTTDVTDRSMLKIGAFGPGTAVIPQPVAHHLMNTPLPAGGIPQGTAAMPTPNPAGGGTPFPQAQSTTGNPVAHTFSGMGDTPGVPKKGVPVAIIGGAAAAVLVVVGVIVGITVVGSRAGAAAAPEITSASVTPPDLPPSASVAATAPAPTETAPRPTETATASVAADPPPTPTAATAAPHATGHAPAANHPAPTAATATAAAPTTTGKPPASATAGPKKPKPVNLGF